MREKRNTLDKKDEKLKFKKIAKKQKLQEQGITLIALVVTIIILLILTGVTLNIALSDNGLFNKTQLAVKKYDVASEQEVLQQQVLLYMLDKNTTKVGEELSDRKSIADSNWKIIQMNNSNQNYGTNYNYIPKGTEISGYGETKYNWVMNYKNGEIINIEDYTKLDGNIGISIKEDMALNINPLNISNEDNWGDGVKFIGNDDKASGFDDKELKLKFDGKDDYLRLDNIKIEKNKGFTFEFYGKGIKDKNIYIGKTKYNDEDISIKELTSFRINLYNEQCECCFGEGDSGSDLAPEAAKYWIHFDDKKLWDPNEERYVSLTCDYETCSVSFYVNRKFSWPNDLL